MKPRLFSLGLWALLVLGPAGASGAPTRPNVLLVAVDDMNDWVGCLGGYAGKVHTPNIDRLAARGVLFTDAHCASPKCAPSRTALLTGLMPSSTGFYDNGHWWYPHRPDLATLPQHFRAHGYRALGAGKVHHHTAGFNPPHQWDAFAPLLFRDDPWFRTDRINYPSSPGGPPPAEFPFSGVGQLGHENDWGSLPLPDEALDDVRTIDDAIAFLRTASQRRFFLACGTFRPHLPWYVPSRFFDLYPRDEIRLPTVLAEDLADLPPTALKLAAAGRRDFEHIREAGKWREAVRAYLASISFADAQVGRLLDALAASPTAANTIVVFWSDHGWHLGEKAHWHKSTLWQRATRVPLIIAVPNGQPGRCDRPVNLIDLYPTLLELCGLPAPAQRLDGESLVPLLRNPAAPRARPSVIEFLPGNAAVCDEHYRYIRYRDGGEELYDRRGDPHEWHNLASDRAHGATKDRLARWLPAAWSEAAPIKNAYDFDFATHTWIEKTSGKSTRPPVESGRRAATPRHPD